MSELWIYQTYIPREGRGLASSTGFEEEDRKRAEQTAAAAYNTKLLRLQMAAEEWASECWRQGRARFSRPESLFVSDFVESVKGIASDVSKDTP